jgi:hypothetical protein
VVLELVNTASLVRRLVSSLIDKCVPFPATEPTVIEGNPDPYRRAVHGRGTEAGAAADRPNPERRATTHRDRHGLRRRPHSFPFST